MPALKAAADGTVAPDDFIRRFVLNGKVEELQGMAKILKATDPDAYGQARSADRRAPEPGGFRGKCDG